MKKFISIVLTIAFAFSMLTALPAAAASNIKIDGVDIGYAAGQYFSENGKACTCHNKGICVPKKAGCNCKHVEGTAQCYGFALWCENKLYGCNDVSSSNKFKTIGSSVAAGKLTASKLKELINEAPIGSHIRTNKGSASEHSMILISKSSTGFTIAQANGSNNNEYTSWAACRIGTATYTWDSYIKSTYGARGIQFIKAYKNSSNGASNNSGSSNSNSSNSTVKWPATSKIKTYVKSTGNDTTVYQTATSTAKYGTIYATDLITINKYDSSSKRVNVTYPVSNGTKTGWIPLSAVTSSTWNTATAKKTASAKMTTYRRSSGSAEMGYISKGDVYYVIASANGRTQVIYPISGGYKIGWIK